MATNSQIISSVARTMKDPTFKQRGKDVYIGVLNDAQVYIVERTDCLRKIDSSSVILTTDQEYDLPSDFLKFPGKASETKRGVVSIGTNGAVQLESITTDLLNNKYGAWRATSAGTPEFYYIVMQGTPKIGFYPKASSSWLASNGTSVYLDMVYLPLDIEDNSNLPFDNSSVLRPLQAPLKFEALWNLKLEDWDIEQADRWRVRVDQRIEEMADFVNRVFPVNRSHGFEKNNF